MIHMESQRFVSVD